MKNLMRNPHKKTTCLQRSDDVQFQVITSLWKKVSNFFIRAYPARSSLKLQLQRKARKVARYSKKLIIRAYFLAFYFDYLDQT